MDETLQKTGRRLTHALSGRPSTNGLTLRLGRCPAFAGSMSDFAKVSAQRSPVHALEHRMLTRAHHAAAINTQLGTVVGPALRLAAAVGTPRFCGRRWLLLIPVQQ